MTADVTEDLGSEVNVVFTIDAPPVVTEAIRAAGPEDGDLDAHIPLIADRGQSLFRATVDPRTVSGPGKPIRLSLDPRRFYFFDPHTGEAVGSRRPAPTA